MTFRLETGISKSFFYVVRGGGVFKWEHRGQRLEGWPDTAEASDPAEYDSVCDRRSMPPALTDLATCPGLGPMY